MQDIRESRALPEARGVGLVTRGLRAGWLLSLYPEAAEAGGCFRSLSRPRGPGEWRPGTDPALASDRAATEAARRARGKVRRYCATNRLNRLGTLTYRGAGCHDPRQVRADAGRFFRRLRAELPAGRPLPYVWVPEWHPGGHGLHLHFAVGRFIRRSDIETAWGHGFVHIKQLGDVRVGAGALGEARLAARYLGKYIGEALDERRVAGLHRYERAEGHDPRVVHVEGGSREAVIAAASARLGRDPQRVWTSDDTEGWQGPPAVWVQWP